MDEVPGLPRGEGEAFDGVQEPPVLFEVGLGIKEHTGGVSVLREPGASKGGKLLWAGCGDGGATR